ncbi:hypothetical protein HII23_22925, partial [Escherichia coli]|nr:hypothetical protein [Escherichia coli]
MNQKWKTLIISLLTPSSIISGIALIVLWGYFSRLGRLDIFFDVMNIKSILVFGFAPIFPDICYHLTHYKPAAADIPVASDNPAHYADA